MRYFGNLSEKETEKIFFSPPKVFTKDSEKDILSYALGATLYMPATRETISNDIINNKYENLISMVICLEDAIGDKEINKAEEYLEKHIKSLYLAVEKNNILNEDIPLIFLRVRNPKQIKRIYEKLGSILNLITGFVLPKFSVENGEQYFEEINKVNHSLNKNFYGMPILETEDIIYSESRKETLININDILHKNKDLVLNIRIGGTDFSSLFGIRRSCNLSIYDIAVIRDCIADIINTFTRINRGYIVSGPVWEYFDVGGLINEGLLDKENGLVGKTVIHPSHILPIQAMQVVSYEEYMDAQSILLNNDGDIGVIKSCYGNKMNEIKPHIQWAKKVVQKGNIYGVFKKIKTSQICSKHNYSYNVFNKFNLNINVKDNVYDIPLDTLFSIAERKNKKRAFLFVSKILGKHIPVLPEVPLLAGYVLAGRYMEIVHNEECSYINEVISCLISQKNYKETYDRVSKIKFNLDKSPVFIGFAETATALGHAMYNCFTNAEFIHTTRENILELSSIINFEEEHSHATAHRCYALNQQILNSDNPIVLVDDEITTGKTALNIIEAIQRKYPRKEYVIVSLLDWRNNEYVDMFRAKEKELGISIKEVSLVSGTIDVEAMNLKEETFNNVENINTDELKKINVEYIYLDNFFKNQVSVNTLNSPYLLETGRFGIDSKDNIVIDKLVFNIAEHILKTRKGKTTLCLGSGEFMYLPMRIASNMGEGVLYHSTTRSPIYSSDKLEYAIENAFSFPNYEDKDIVNYVYNIPSDYYDDVYLFIERDIDKEKLKSVLDIFKRTGISNVFVVIFAKKQI